LYQGSGHNEALQCLYVLRYSRPNGWVYDADNLIPFASDDSTITVIYD
jgi:hypothetical protein